jgi:hypothetical protein
MKLFQLIKYIMLTNWSYVNGCLHTQWHGWARSSPLVETLDMQLVANWATASLSVSCTYHRQRRSPMCCAAMHMTRCCALFLRFTSHRVCMHTSALSFRSPYVKPVRRCALQQCILYRTMKVAFHNNLSTFCLTPRQPDYLSETTFCSQASAQTLSSNRREQHTDPALGSSNLNRA